MFIADCEEWFDIILPNLPVCHRDEYLLKLAEFRPDCEMETVNINCLKCVPTFTFPFVDIDNDFPYGEYDDYACAVESEMIEKYPDLTEQSFCP